VADNNITELIAIFLVLFRHPRQVLTLVHFSAQLEGVVWIGGARRCCVVHVKGVLGGA
jgi:hypothetical protein